MIDVAAIRADLAGVLEHLPVTVYTELPGSVTPPAVVVGLPTTISFEQSHTLGVCDIPITVVTGPMFNRTAETELMSTALAVANAIRNVRTVNVAGCRFVDIDQTTEIAVGDQLPLYSTNVNTQVITHTQES